MSKDFTKSNILTGFVLVVGVAAFCGMMVFLQGYDPAPVGDAYTVVLQNAPGIAKNSAVTVGGLRVGKVESVEVRQTPSQATGQLTTEVLVNVRIEPQHASSFRIHQNASASVVTAVFGRASLSINPGGEGVFGANPNQPAIPFPESPERKVIRGNTPPGLDELSRKAAVIADVVTELLGDVRTLVKDVNGSGIGETNREVRELLQAVTARVKQTESVITELQGTATSARKTMDTLASSVEKSAGSIDATMANVSSITAKTDDFMGERLNKLADALDKALTEIGTLAASSNAMITENRANLNATMGNVRDITANLRDMSAKLRRDPSIIVWGSKEDDNAADRKSDAPRGIIVDEARLRDNGALPIRERD